MHKFEEFITIASEALHSLWSTKVEFLVQNSEPQTEEVTLNHAVDFNVMKMSPKSTKSVLIIAKWALTAAMVTEDQNRIKDTIAVSDHRCTISSEISKRPTLSTKANKKPFNLYKMTICSYLITESNCHFYKNKVFTKVLQYLDDEAVVQTNETLKDEVFSIHQFSQTGEYDERIDSIFVIIK